MPCRLTILGSGSSGNCAFVETETTRLLVDAGLSGRQIEERLASIGRRTDQLHGILVTHEHSDHVEGLRVLAARYRIPIYANRLTHAAILEGFSSSGTGRASSFSWRIFESGQGFAEGDFDVESFPVPHDASDPVGFLIHHGGHCIAFLTDLGHTPRLVLEKAKQADVLLLETNHDLKLLQNDPTRPWSVKQRILSRHGHLSNDSAAEALAAIMNDRLHHVYLSHLSRDCNRPELAEMVMRRKLKEIGASHVHLTITHQVKPSVTESLERTRPRRVETIPLFNAVTPV